jgi:hypothetical protein
MHLVSSEDFLFNLRSLISRCLWQYSLTIGDPQHLQMSLDPHQVSVSVTIHALYVELWSGVYW